MDLPTRERAFLWAYAVRAVDREAVGKGRAAAKAVGAVAGEMQASTAAEKEEVRHNCQSTPLPFAHYGTRTPYRTGTRTPKLAGLPYCCCRCSCWSASCPPATS